MSQINIRISENDYKILKIIAERENIPITTLYKIIVSSSFNEWKTSEIIKLYAKGAIRFKDAATLSELTLNEFILELSNREIEPPHTREMEEASETISNTITRNELLKDPNYMRKSKEKM